MPLTRSFKETVKARAEREKRVQWRESDVYQIGFPVAADGSHLPLDGGDPARVA